MNWLTFYLPDHTINAIGWAVVHSLWQGAIIVLVTAIILRLFNIRKAEIRYWVLVSAMLATVAWTYHTFSFYNNAPITFQTPDLAEIPTSSTSTGILTIQEINFIQKAPALVDYFTQVNRYFQRYTIYIATFWLLGTLLFLSKLAGSMLQIEKLKTTSIHPVPAQWLDRFTTLARKMGIHKRLKIFESEMVTSPMVVGYLKPVVLLPVGLCSGLSTDQVEAILAHELAHIRRSDFLVNVVQLIIESVLFFNPAIWWFSAKIRKEREHCCDDIAIKVCNNKMAYARALTNVAALQLQHQTMALALANNKNQLLKRIKRLMEPKKSYKGLERPISGIILIMALMSISWYSKKTTPKINGVLASTNMEASILPATIFRPETTFERDTVKENIQETKTEERTTKFYRKKHTIKIDEDGNREETIEEEGDPSIAEVIPDEPTPNVFVIPEMEDAFVMGFDMPSIPEFDFEQLGITVLPDMPDIPDMSSFNFRIVDEIVPNIQVFWTDTTDENYAEWKMELKENAMELRQQILEHEEELRALQQELAGSYKEMAKKMRKEHRAQEAQRREQIRKSVKAYSERIREQNERIRERHEASARRIREAAEKNANMWRMKSNNFRDEINTELRADGYLKKNEALSKLKIKKSGNLIEVNGKKIKSEHQKKYSKLMKKYFGDTENSNFSFQFN